MTTASQSCQKRPLPARAQRELWEGRAARRREAPSTDRGWASTLYYPDPQSPQYLPDLETVLQKTDPDKLKARRDEAFEELKTKPEEPAPVEVPPKSGEVNETQATAVAPSRKPLSRRTIIAVVIALLVVAPFVIVGVVARLKPAEKAGERAAASAAPVVAPAASSSSIEERPAASAVPAVSATAPLPAVSVVPAVSATATPQQQTRSKKKAEAVDAGSTTPPAKPDPGTDIW
jgi:hypothetical protein